MRAIHYYLASYQITKPTFIVFTFFLAMYINYLPHKASNSSWLLITIVFPSLLIVKGNT